MHTENHLVYLIAMGCEIIDRGQCEMMGYKHESFSFKSTSPEYKIQFSWTHNSANEWMSLDVNSSSVTIQQTDFIMKRNELVRNLSSTNL